MDENTRARAFEPFFTTKPVGQGTGLGLSVVHGIVATHHGAITLNTAPRRGSRFDVYLPLLAADAPVVASAPAAPVGPRAIARHVVYLDDDPVMGLMVEGLLERAGHRVTCFQDPRAAIATLRAQPDGFDLVITDYNMPGLSGLDVARELAGFAAGLPVVLTSGYVSDEVLAAARELGVRHVMQKEYTLEQLAVVVQRVLGERAAPADGPA
jgi:CheY-like chemotaxis protein